MQGHNLLCQFRRVAIRSERHHLVFVGVAREHIESVLADRARRSQHGNADHAATPTAVNPKNSTGAAPVTLSMRSMTPPCPGKTLPLSFTPANLFKRLSVRSPTIEKATPARHRGRKNASGI